MLSEWKAECEHGVALEVGADCVACEAQEAQEAIWRALEEDDREAIATWDAEMAPVGDRFF